MVIRSLPIGINLKILTGFFYLTNRCFANCRGDSRLFRRPANIGSCQKTHYNNQRVLLNIFRAFAFLLFPSLLIHMITFAQVPLKRTVFTVSLRYYSQPLLMHISVWKRPGKKTFGVVL